MKKVISVSVADDGSIKGVLFEGNKRPTPTKTVIRMAEEGKVDLADCGLQLVVMQDGGKYLRSIPNDIIEDNLGHMADTVLADEAAKDELWEDMKAVEATSPGIMAKIRKMLGSLLG